jgi:sugar phosphate isomerase/epimerase
MAADWLSALKAAAAHGFEAFEITCVFPSAEPENPSASQIAEAKEVIQASGMEVCLHAPFFDLNPAAFSPGIRRASVEILKKSVDFCAEASGKTLILHSGTRTYDPIEGLPDEENPLLRMQWEQNIASLREINAYANRRGVTVCLENIGFNSLDQSFQDLIEIRKAVGDSLKFTLDFGHARLGEGAEKGILLLGEHIRHIHLHDNFGVKDDHLPLGEGNGDFSPFVDFFRSFPYLITLEVLGIRQDMGPVLLSRSNFWKLIA